MNKEELVTRLTKDLKSINVPIDEVDLYIRPYSKTYYGRYYPSVSEDIRPRLFIYPYKDKKGNMYSYENVLCTTIHEMVHHIQHTDRSFIRLKGVMHDTNFWKLYNRYVLKAHKNIIGGDNIANNKTKIQTS